MTGRAFGQHAYEIQAYLAGATGPVVARELIRVPADLDEDWSYPGDELDEIECAEGVEDAPDHCDPGQSAAQLEAEILNEAPDPDSYRPTPTLGGGFRF